jgi:hypothetical protein
VREDLDSRILAALRFRDATVDSVVTTPLRITGERIRIVRNLSGFHVLTEAPGFAAYTAAFRDPPDVAPEDLELTVHDPAHRYLPRVFTVELPRDIDPAQLEEDDSIWRPVEVKLYPSPTGTPGVGWASLYLSIKRAGTDQGLPFAYVRVMAADAAPDDDPLAVGFADHRGEAFVPVANVPVTSWSTEATTSPIITTLAVKVTAYYDAAAYDERTGRFPDPDVLAETFADHPHSEAEDFNLRSGRAEPRRIDVPVP